jgi:dTDP-L-rhamnose 4-epimerase
MAIDTVLITGGAGFIGQHACRAFLRAGASVRVLDNFQPQIHGRNGRIAKDLEGAVELIHGDIRDRELVAKALAGVQKIVHLAAETGTGQSMYEVERYFGVNVQGTAVLIDLLQNSPAGSGIRSVVVASSRAIYGEGAYRCLEHGSVYPAPRTATDLERANFEPRCPKCGAAVSSEPTPENAPLNPMSMYGLTKQVQEQLILMYCRNRGINGVALRYQNVYGPGQSLRNPYTGILAVFSNLARQRQDIEIYEDGLESRDFVYVDDVVAATLRANSMATPFCGSLNIGSGVATTVHQVATQISAHFRNSSAIKVTGAFRVGDIRHNVASLLRAKEVLNFSPSISFEIGIKRFLEWAESQEAADMGAYAASVAELSSRGLMGRGS